MSSKERNENPNADLRSAADILTKGGILIREPCDECNGVQVKFKDELKCVNCGRVRNVSRVYERQSKITAEDNITNNSKKILHSTHSDSLFNSEFHDIAVASVKRRILELTTNIKNDDSIFNETGRAQLMDTYLNILERLSRLRDL
jgi:uncharacterized Zn finger protein (UPF0148 family)